MLIAVRRYHDVGSRIKYDLFRDTRLGIGSMNTFIAFLFGIQAVNHVMPAWVLRICFPLETAVAIEHLPLNI